MKRQWKDITSTLVLPDELLSVIVSFVALPREELTSSGRKIVACDWRADVNSVRVCLVLGCVNRDYRVIAERLMALVRRFDCPMTLLTQEQLDRLVGLVRLRRKMLDSWQRIDHLKFLRELSLTKFCSAVSLPVTLRQLNLCHNTSFTDLSHLTALTVLSYPSDQITTLCTLTNLTSLLLGFNRTITDLRHNLLLTDLHLSANNTISDISYLTALRKLSSHSNITSLTTLTRLTHLRNVGPNCDIAMLTGLRMLSLGPQATIKDLSPLTNLTHLQLFDNDTIDLTTLPKSLKKLFFNGRM